MTDITIPPEALEAAAKAMWKTDDPSQWELGMARAALLAGLKAWPGAKHVTEYYLDTGDYFKPSIILPLTEKQNG